MIEVELPDGSVAEFDDTTPPDAIKKAVQGYAVKSEAKNRLKDMSSFRKTLYGAERALDEPAMGLKQMIVGLSDQDKHDLAVRRQMEDQIPGSWIPRMAGDVALLAAPGAGVAKGVSMLPKTMATVGKYAGAVGLGAGAGAMNATLEGESRGKNAAAGGLFGALGQGAGDVVGRVISGIVPKSAAAKTLPQNVQDAATLGQVADRTSTTGRIFSALEEKMKSVPIIGSAIDHARSRGTDAWRNDVIAKGTPDGFTPQTGGSTRDKVDDIYKEFQTRYSRALRGHQVTPSQFFEQELLKISTDPKNGLSAEMAENLSRDIMRNYQARFAAVTPNRGPAGTAIASPGNPGTITAMRGDEAKGFEAFLGGRSRQYAKSVDNPLNPDIARFYDQVERAWSAAYKRQLGPSVRAELKPLDSKYAPYKTVERAASTLGNTGGDFTPSQLTNAVSARTGKAKFGRGEGLLADEAQAGKAAFQDHIPNSGTAERTALGATAAGMWIDPITTLGTYGAMGASLPLFTSKTGKNAMTGDLKLQKLLQALRAHEAARSAGAPLGIAAQDIMTNESTRY